MKTLLEIILTDWHASGHTGKLTRAFIDAWHVANPIYGAGKWGLEVQFSSGSAVPVRGKTTDDRATLAWIRAGNPGPVSPGFDRTAFNTYLDRYRDEYNIEFYGDPQPAKPPTPERAVKKPKR